MTKSLKKSCFPPDIVIPRGFGPAYYGQWGSYQKKVCGFGCMLLAVGWLHFKWRFNGTLMAIQLNFNITSMALPGTSLAFFILKNILASIRIGQEIQCLPYAQFFITWILLIKHLYTVALF